MPHQHGWLANVFIWNLIPESNKAAIDILNIFWIWMMMNHFGALSEKKIPNMYFLMGNFILFSI